MSTKNVPQVMEEIGEIVGSIHKSAINGALLNPQIHERIVKGCG